MAYAIKAQFETTCSPQAVHRWLASPAGIAGWWSDTVDGHANAVGDVFHVTFPDSPVPFDLRVAAIDEETIAWAVDESPPWWKGTTIRFDLSATESGSRFLFTHSGFRPDDPIIEIITPAWVRFLDNLVSVAQSGTPNPAVVN